MLQYIDYTKCNNLAKGTCMSNNGFRSNNVTVHKRTNLQVLAKGENRNRDLKHRGLMRYNRNN